MWYAHSPAPCACMEAQLARMQATRNVTRECCLSLKRPAAGGMAGAHLGPLYPVGRPAGQAADLGGAVEHEALVAPGGEVGAAVQLHPPRSASRPAAAACRTRRTSSTGPSP